MIKLISSKEYFKKIFRNTTTEDDIDKIKSDRLEMWLGTPEEVKTNNQNSCFHGLLGVYWSSGLSSYNTPEQMRVRFKRVAGLIIEEDRYVDEETKQFLRDVYAKLPKSKIKDGIANLVNGKKEIELSWSKVNKKKASLAIEELIDEMVDSGVNGKEFDKLMRRLGR